MNLWSGLVVTALLTAMVGCSRPSATQLPGFSIANEIAGGEYRQVLTVTNGASLYFTSTDLVIWFRDGSSFVIQVEASNGSPMNVLLNRPTTADHPAESVFDINADGVPELRDLHTSSPYKELLYEGEWYRKQNRGSNSVIVIDGKEVEVRFDGRRFARAAGAPVGTKVSE